VFLFTRMIGDNSADLYSVGAGWKSPVPCPRALLPATPNLEEYTNRELPKENSSHAVKYGVVAIGDCKLGRTESHFGERLNSIWYKGGADLLRLPFQASPGSIER
jgi:hypothetical protein